MSTLREASTVEATESAPAPRTYEVRTFGCQMNVHDSERLSGSLEAAGYVPADGAEPDIVVINTCAVRENADNKLYGNLGHLAGVKRRHAGHADRRRRLPRPEGQERHPREGALGRRRLRHAQHGLAAEPARARPPQRRGAARDPRLPRGVPVDAARPSATRPTAAGCPSRSAATTPAPSASCPRCAARRRTAAPARSSPRSRRSSTTAPSRSPCSARTSTPTASSSATGRRSASCSAPPAQIDGLERIRFTSPHPAAFTDDVIDAMAETPVRHAAAAHAAAVGLRPHPQGDAPVLPVREVPRHPRPRARPHPERGHLHRHHRRVPRRDRGGLPGDAARGRGRALRLGVHLPVLDPPRHARPRPWTTRCRRRSCRSATSASSRCRSASRGRRTRSSSAARSRCSSPRARARRTPRRTA